MEQNLIIQAIKNNDIKQLSSVVNTAVSLNINGQDSDGNTPLHLILLHNDTEFKQQAIEIITKLNPNPNIKNNNGEYINIKKINTSSTETESEILSDSSTISQNGGLYKLLNDI